METLDLNIVILTISLCMAIDERVLEHLPERDFEDVEGFFEPVEVAEVRLAGASAPTELRYVGGLTYVAGDKQLVLGDVKMDGGDLVFSRLTPVQHLSSYEPLLLYDE